MSAIGIFLVGVVVVVFGIIGFVRGWFREVVALAGLLLGWAIVLQIGQPIVALVNRVYLLGAFVAQGGLDAADPGALLRQLRASPLVEAAHPDLLFAVVFVVTVVAGYWLGSWRAPGPTGLASQVLGVLVGLIEGYLLSCFILQYAAPALVGKTFASTAELAGRYLQPVIAAGVLVVAAAALYQLRGSARSGGGRAGVPARSRR